jgi:hypothetical protein
LPPSGENGAGLAVAVGVLSAERPARGGVADLLQAVVLPVGLVVPVDVRRVVVPVDAFYLLGGIACPVSPDDLNLRTRLDFKDMAPVDKRVNVHSIIIIYYHYVSTHIIF